MTGADWQMVTMLCADWQMVTVLSAEWLESVLTPNWSGSMQKMVLIGDTERRSSLYAVLFLLPSVSSQLGIQRGTPSTALKLAHI